MEGDKGSPNPTFLADWTVGVVLHVKTTLNEEFEGEVFAYDSKANLLVICISFFGYNFVFSFYCIIALDLRLQLKPQRRACG